MPSVAMYSLKLTREAQKFYEQTEPSLVRRINRCFEQLAENPYEHPNIKALRGALLETVLERFFTLKRAGFHEKREILQSLFG